MENNNTVKRSEFYLGTFGALVPFLGFLALVIYLVVAGMLGSKTAGGAAFVGFLVAFFMIKDKHRFAELTIKGFTSTMSGTMLVAFLLAGVIAKIMAMAGMVDALVWAASKIGADGRMMPILIFLVSCIISSATGTSGGTMATTTPILFPMAVALGCNPGLAMGAILSGAMFGDNIAPVSDTTIASALTQETTVVDVVKSRMKYSLIAAAVALILYAIFGFTTVDAGAAMSVDTSNANPLALILLSVPVLVIILMMRQKGLIFSMIWGVVLGIVLSLVLGLIPASRFLPGDGVFVSGFDGMMGIFCFFYFTFVLNEILIEGQVIDKLLNALEKHAKTPRSAEAISGLITCIGIALISSPTVNIVTVGPVVRKIMKNHNIARARGANMLDGLSCALGGTLPYTSTCIYPLAMAIATGAVAETFSVMDYVPYSFHCMALFVVYWLAILTGYGRKFEKAEDVESVDLV